MGFFRRRPAGPSAAETNTAISEYSMRGGDGGWLTAIASAIALLFSAYSLYETSLRHPDLRAFVPPVIEYSSPYNNSNFEVFGIPVTVANLGARAGTVLSMDLEVTNPRTKETKQFYSAEFGRWTMENVRTFKLRQFAPLTLPGKSSASESILFHSRTDEKVQSIAPEKGTYQFKLMLNIAVPEELGGLDHYWMRKPQPLVFEMEMPEVDHRAFIEGTLALHSKNFQASGGTP